MRVIDYFERQNSLNPLCLSFLAMYVRINHGSIVYVTIVNVLLTLALLGTPYKHVQSTLKIPLISLA